MMLQVLEDQVLLLHLHQQVDFQRQEQLKLEQNLFLTLVYLQMILQELPELLQVQDLLMRLDLVLSTTLVGDKLLYLQL